MSYVAPPNGWFIMVKSYGKQSMIFWVIYRSLTWHTGLVGLNIYRTPIPWPELSLRGSPNGFLLDDQTLKI